MSAGFFERYKKGIIAFFVIAAAFAAMWLLAVGLQKREENRAEWTVRYTEEVAAAAAKYDVPASRIYAVIKVESDFDPKAESSHGARGLMQMLPSTFEEQCEVRGEKYDASRLYEPAVNIDYCTEYLKILYDMTEDWRWAHIAYFAGIGNVLRWIDAGYTPENIPMDSAKTYLRRINDAFAAYDELLKTE